MARTVLFFSVISFLFVFSGCNNVESTYREGYDFSAVEKVAVVDVVGNVGGEMARNQIADFFVMELLKKGYAPIERNQVQTILEEQQFQASDLTRPEDAARAGQILNVPAVIVVNAPEFKEDINLTAKMINVEDGSIVWAASASGSTGQTLNTILGAAGGAAAGAAVAGDEEVVGAVAGGILGGVAGHALSPKEADKVQELVKEMCEKMPPRYNMTPFR